MNDSARQAIVYRLPVIKGICVLAVILTHATATIWRPFSWPLAPEVFANTLARFAVPLFIVMSGFYLSLHARNQHARRFYRRTLPRLILPYVVYTTIYVLAGNPDLAHVLRSGPGHLLHGTASPHLWFIPVIIELYLLHPFLRSWYAGSKKPGRLAALAVAAQVAYVFVHELAVLPRVPLAGWSDVAVSGVSFLKFIGYFVLGYYLRDNASVFLEAVRQRGAWPAAAAAWMVTGAILPAVWASQALSCCPAQWARSSRIAVDLLAIPLAVAALSMVMAWRAAWRWPSPVRRAVQVSGLYAYGVYYLHPLILTLAAWTLHRHAGALTAPGPLRAGLLFLLGAGGTVVAVKLLVRLPLTRYLA